MRCAGPVSTGRIFGWCVPGSSPRRRCWCAVTEHSGGGACRRRYTRQRERGRTTAIRRSARRTRRRWPVGWVQEMRQKTTGCRSWRAMWRRPSRQRRWPKRNGAARSWTRTWRCARPRCRRGWWTISGGWCWRRTMCSSTKRAAGAAPASAAGRRCGRRMHQTGSRRERSAIAPPAG